MRTLNRITFAPNQNSEHIYTYQEGKGLDQESRAKTPHLQKYMHLEKTTNAMVLPKKKKVKVKFLFPKHHQQRQNNNNNNNNNNIVNFINLLPMFSNFSHLSLGYVLSTFHLWKFFFSIFFFFQFVSKYKLLSRNNYNRMLQKFALLSSHKDKTQMTDASDQDFDSPHAERKMFYNKNRQKRNLLPP